MSLLARTSRLLQLKRRHELPAAEEHKITAARQEALTFLAADEFFHEPAKRHHPKFKPLTSVFTSCKLTPALHLQLVQRFQVEMDHASLEMLVTGCWNTSDMDQKTQELWDSYARREVYHPSFTFEPAVCEAHVHAWQALWDMPVFEREAKRWKMPATIPAGGDVGVIPLVRPPRSDNDKESQDKLKPVRLALEALVRDDGMDAAVLKRFDQYLAWFCDTTHGAHKLPSHAWYQATMEKGGLVQSPLADEGLLDVENVWQLLDVPKQLQAKLKALIPKMELALDEAEYAIKIADYRAKVAAGQPAKEPKAPKEKKLSQGSARFFPKCILWKRHASILDDLLALLLVAFLSREGKLPPSWLVGSWKAAQVVALLKTVGTGDFFKRSFADQMPEALFIDGELDDLYTVVFLRAVAAMVGAPQPTVFWQVQEKPLANGSKLIEQLKATYDAHELDIVFYEDSGCNNGEPVLIAQEFLRGEAKEQ